MCSGNNGADQTLAAQLRREEQRAEVQAARAQLRLLPWAVPTLPALPALHTWGGGQRWNDGETWGTAAAEPAEPLPEDGDAPTP